MIHRRLLALARVVAWQVVVVAAASLLIAATYLGQALSVATALTALLADDLPTVATAVGVGLAVLAVRALLLWARELLIARCGVTIRTRLRDDLLRRVVALGPAWAAGDRAGRVTSTVVDGVEALDAYYSRYLPQLVVVVVVPFGIVAWLFTVSLPAAAVVAVAVLVAVVAPRFWDARLLRTGRQRWAALDRLTADHLEATQAVPVLRMFAATDRVAAELSGRSERLRLLTMSQLRVSLVEAGVSALALHLGVALTVLVAAQGVLAGEQPTGAVFVFLLCARECFRPISDLSTHWHAGYQGLGAVDGIDEVLAARPDVPDTGQRSAPAEENADLVLREVTFQHSSGGGVRDVTLRCPSGRTVGLVGPSGAGKSTVARLLERQVDPQQGVIELGGVPLPDYTLEALRSSITVVGQETHLFHGTIEENLLLGRPDATREELRLAAHTADALEFVEALPEGFDTVLEENGRQLSGGQRQRLAIARALVAARPVLVLDEATSALDIDTEDRVLSRLADFPRCPTRLVIAHRASALRDAHTVVTLDQGRVVESTDRVGRP
ncbi:ABC transporter ATP-binding protein/permease [Actinoalloteichus spitiensis]|uniref:ABC transporter ATP-binding protein/permease n=1 Tax=Actinoalloteichus spitiensis TaxID=252394 RepID=UPI0003661E5F|nr:ATP-binding cassette domain-containing protein [Actinoalloteichus spitiensis]